MRRHAVHFEQARTVFEEDEALMKAHFDFAAGVKNPSATRLKRSVTIRLDESTVDYFKALATETELPYQSLINLYLRDCAASGRRLSLSWRPARARAVSRCLLQRGAVFGSALIAHSM